MWCISTSAVTYPLYRFEGVFDSSDNGRVISNRRTVYLVSVLQHVIGLKKHTKKHASLFHESQVAER